MGTGIWPDGPIGTRTHRRPHISPEDCRSISAVRLSRLEGQLRGQKTSQEEFRLFAHGMVILFAIDVLEGRRP